MCKGYSSIWMALFWIAYSYALDVRDFVRKIKSQWLVVLLVLPLMASCATAWKVVENPIFQSAVQMAIMEYVQKDEIKANEALRIIEELKKHVDASDTITVSDLENKALTEIPWSKLNRRDRLELRGMISAIAAAMRDKVGSGELDGDERVQVLEFFGWIESAMYFAVES